MKHLDWEKLAYQARNLRSLYGSAKVEAGRLLARPFGLLTMHGSLSAELCQRGGRMVNLGLLGKRVITDAGVNFLVDDWDLDTLNISDMNFHDSGTGTTAEAAGDTDLVTPAGPTTRATGSKSQPSANVLRSVGTIAYTGTLAITEHGLFNTASRATANLWDRTVFTAINVANGDSIQFTYDCTLSSGG